jgi:hypothetical protein
MGRTGEAKSLLAEAINRDESLKERALDDCQFDSIWDDIEKVGRLHIFGGPQALIINNLHYVPL